MLHGIGDNPWIFHDVALRLRDRFRVVAYARRGHGSSGSPDSPYDAETLTADLGRVLDHLDLGRASLAGWSLGGNEITSYAGRHPDRVEALVYLDAGYDWSSREFYGAFCDMIAVNAPGDEDLRSLDAFRAWHQGAWLGGIPWSDGLEAYLRDVAHPDAGGALHLVPREDAFAATLATMSTWTRDYRSLRAPVLSLVAETFFPSKHHDAALERKLRAFERDTMVPFRRSSIERLRREAPAVEVVELPGRTHMSIGVERPDEAAAAIARFLSDSR